MICLIAAAGAIQHISARIFAVTLLRMKTLSAITDPVFVKPATYGSLDRFYLRFIRDERDLPFVHLTIRISVTMLPVAILLYLPFVTGWWFALATVVYHYLNNFSYKGP